MAALGLPTGFRFNPTDVELVVHYLKGKATGKRYEEGIIRELDIYKHEPVELPGLSILPSRDPEWYFFCLQDRNGSRITRTTKAGYWKATGRDRIITVSNCRAGVKKTLIYHEGKAPGGKRTDWVMHEYRLGEDLEKKIKTKHHYVLCRVRMKGGPGPRNGEQYGAPVLEDPDIIASGLEGETSGETPEVISRESPDIIASGLERETSGEVPEVISRDSPDIITSGFEGETSGEAPEVISRDSPPHSSDADWLEVLDMVLPIHQTNVEPAGSGTTSQMQSEVPQYFDPIPSAPPQFTSTGFEDLHDILHPDPEECDILGEMLQQITEEGNQVTNTNNYLPSDVFDENLNPPDPFDFIELDDLDSPIGGPMPDLTALEALEDPRFELGMGLETQTTAGWLQEGLVEQGTAVRRLRLQLPATSEGQQFSSGLQLLGGSHHSNEQLIPQVSAHESGMGEVNSLGLENIHNDHHIILHDHNILSSISSTGSDLSLAQYTPNASHSSKSADAGDLLSSIKSPSKQQEVELDSASTGKPVNAIAHTSTSSPSTKVPLSTSVMNVVLGFLEGMPVLPASAFESTSEFRELGSENKILDGKSSRVELDHLHSRSLSSTGTTLHQRKKTFEVEMVAKVHQISKSSSKNSVKGCGIGFSVFLFRIATLVLILFCLFRGFCKLPRNMFTSHL